MAGLDMTIFDPILKEEYVGQRVEMLVAKDNPFMALLKKDEKFGGRNRPLPLIYGNSQNRSATFATAVAGTTTLAPEAFLLTRVKNYSVAVIDGETAKASEADRDAFADALTETVDSAIMALANDIAFGLFRDSSGAMGQVNAEPTEASTTVITLKSADDVVGFEKGQVIVIYSAKTGGSQRLYATGVTSGSISAVDRSAGTITVNTAYDSNGTIAANDYLFVSGDRGLKISGVADWIPDSAPSATSFFGIDRSVDVVRLAGTRKVGTGMPIEEALIDLAYAIGREGGKPDYAFLNFKQYARLCKQLGAKRDYVDVEVAGISFRGVEIAGPQGTIKVLPDRNMTDGRCYMLQMDSWLLASLGPVVHLLDLDDNRILRQTTNDAYEVRIGSYAQLGCKAPAFNGIITLDT